MTHRSILAGQISKVVVHAGGSVRLEGWDSDRVQGESDGRGGLKIERRRETEFGRARAKVGEHVLFDIRLNVPRALKKDADDEVIDVQISSSGVVHVPHGCDVKVYAGGDIEASGLRGTLAAYGGGNVKIRALQTLASASAGGVLDFECESIVGDDLKFTAGGDIRCSVRRLTDVTYLIDDLGGYWEAVIGEGRIKVRLKGGGDVTLVTDQPLNGDILGTIERPPDQAA